MKLNRAVINIRSLHDCVFFAIQLPNCWTLKYCTIAANEQHMCMDGTLGHNLTFRL